MNVIRHDCESMQDMVVKHARVAVNRFDYHSSECWLVKVKWATSSSVEQTVQRREGLSRREIAGLEYSITGKAVVKPPGQEDGLADVIEVRQPAAVEGHTVVVKDGWIVLRGALKCRPGVGKRTRGSAPPSSRQ